MTTPNTDYVLAPCRGCGNSTGDKWSVCAGCRAQGLVSTFEPRFLVVAQNDSSGSEEK